MCKHNYKIRFDLSVPGGHIQNHLYFKPLYIRNTCSQTCIADTNNKAYMGNATALSGLPLNALKQSHPRMVISLQSSHKGEVRNDKHSIKVTPQGA